MENEIEKTLKKLNTFINPRFPILSVYLGASQKKTPPQSQLRSMFHSQIHQNLNGEEQKNKFKSKLLTVG